MKFKTILTLIVLLPNMVYAAPVASGAASYKSGDPTHVGVGGATELE